MSTFDTKPEVPPASSSTETKSQNNNSNVIKKEGCVNKRLLTNHSSYNNTNIENTDSFIEEKEEGVEPEVLEEFKYLYYDRRRYGLIGLRVLPRVKMIWDYMSPEDKKTVREIFENIVLEYHKSRKTVVSNKNIVLNVNVNQQVVNVTKNESVLRLKREIDRLNKELEKALSENLELKKQLDLYRSLVSEVCILLQQLLQHKQKLPLDLVFAVEKILKRCKM